jgi:hypothetical protein
MQLGNYWPQNIASFLTELLLFLSMIGENKEYNRILAGVNSGEETTVDVKM